MRDEPVLIGEQLRGARGEAEAERNGGIGRQGEALLALGLSQRLHGLQQPAPSAVRASGSPGSDGLAALLARREALLRLVDPAALGDFRWLAFSRGEVVSALASGAELFLKDPDPGT